MLKVIQNNRAFESEGTSNSLVYHFMTGLAQNARLGRAPYGDVPSGDYCSGPIMHFRGLVLGRSSNRSLESEGDSSVNSEGALIRESESLGRRVPPGDPNPGCQSGPADALGRYRKR